MVSIVSTDLESGALALVEGETNLIANLANLSAHLFMTIPGLNWAGFYLWSQEDQELVLGPFQGKPACIRIPPDRGVCGKAFSTRLSQRVDDVHALSYHIACDPESRSELVIPFFRGAECIGVLDLDAPTVGFFSETLQLQLESLCQKLSKVL